MKKEIVDSLEGFPNILKPEGWICPHCEFIHKTFKNITTNYEYWLMTEVFVYLHHGKDSCDGVGNLLYKEGN